MFRAERYALDIPGTPRPSISVSCMDCFIANDTPGKLPKPDVHYMIVEQPEDGDWIFSAFCLWIEIHERRYHTPVGDKVGDIQLWKEPERVDWLRANNGEYIY